MIEVYLTTNRFLERRYTNTAIVTLPEPTSYTPALVEGAQRALAGIFRHGWDYHKVGVYFMDLSSEVRAQIDFLSDPERAERELRLMHAMDRVNKGWGRNTVRPAAAGIAQPWKMKRARLSSRFTTCWSQLPEAIM